MKEFSESAHVTHMLIFSNITHFTCNAFRTEEIKEELFM